MDQAMEERLNTECDTVVRLWPKSIREAAHDAAAHLARYVFAEGFIAGKSVCDIACGVGYGSCYLAEKAKKVVGMDISAEAIDWACRYFARDNVSFLRADGQAPWPVDEKFDVITTFETMEHLRSPESFVVNVHEHLLPGGVVIISVPNGPRDLKRTNNPYHLHHFDRGDLERLIGTTFADVEYFSQAYHKDMKHYAAKCLRKIRMLKKQPYFVRNYFLKPGMQSESKTWLMIARK